jgi:hypothetical protein
MGAGGPRATAADRLSPAWLVLGVLAALSMADGPAPGVAK